MMRRPGARVAVKVQASNRTRLRVLTYGEDDRVPNPGDLLLVSEIGDATNGLVEMAVLIAGRDMAQLAPAVNACVLEYEANKDWLSEPVTKVRTA